MSDNTTKSIDIKAQVEARIQEEAPAIPPVEEQKNKKFSLSFLSTCLRGNRVGDATLYAAMHRGKFLFVERWGRYGLIDQFGQAGCRSAQTYAGLAVHLGGLGL